MAVRIAIEGNIAAGKSTFLQILAEAGLGFVCVPEPVNKWQSLPADDDGPQPLSASQEAGCNILDKVRRIMCSNLSHHWFCSRPRSP